MGPPRGGGHGHAQRTEQRAQEGQPLFDVTADQELGRSQSLELQRFGGGGRFGRFEIGLRSIEPSAGIGQRVAQLLREDARLGAGSLVELQRDPIEPRRMVKGESRRGLVGPASIVFAGALVVARTMQVAREDLRIDRSRGGQHQREPFVVPSQCIGRQVRHHGLPDSVVVDFDVIMLGLADAADQTSGAERSEGHAAADPQLARLERESLADRPAGNRDDSQQPPRIFGLTLNARPENFVEVELADLFPIIGRLGRSGCA